MLNDVTVQALNQIARDLGRSRSLDEVLRTIVDSVTVSLPEIDHAGISVTRRDREFETRVWTDPLVTDLDAIQYELNEGPCIDAMDPKIPADIVRVEHAAQDLRWPRYMPRAVQEGLRAQLGLRLFTEDQTIGGLNLYSTSADTISEDTQQLAELFATHAALALGRVRERTDWSAALESRTIVGQAVGIVMERYDLNNDRAFDYLVRVSQTSNIKIRHLAEDLVEHRDLPSTAKSDESGWDGVRAT